MSETGKKGALRMSDLPSLLTDSVKLALRITTSAFDSEINGLLAACEADLAIAGVAWDESDALINRACILYCKAHFGYNEESEKFFRAYEFLKGALCLSGDYHETE
jgi:hypothetical protein